MLINAILSGITLILIITLGAFYSIDLIMYLYIGGLLIVTLPLTLYRGYYLSFGFSFREIAQLSLDYYLGALVLLMLKWFQRDEWLAYPLLLLGLVSLSSMIRFLYSFSTKHNR